MYLILIVIINSKLNINMDLLAGACITCAGIVVMAHGIDILADQIFTKPPRMVFMPQQMIGSPINDICKSDCPLEDCIRCGPVRSTGGSTDSDSERPMSHVP